MSDASDRLFFEVFEHLPRQGPGSFACAERALAACAGLPQRPRVIDLGCGGGGQTLQLATLTQGSILAVDTHEPLVQRLRAAAAEAGLDGRIEARVADMAGLGLRGQFDLVWSEGALYNLGLAEALPLCASLLRPGGFLVFTDAIWLSEDPPPQVRRAFADAPSMGRREDVERRLLSGPWELLESFLLPPEAWWQDFYGPMERRIGDLRQRHGGDAEALAALDVIASEPLMHREHGHHYAYACFVARIRARELCSPR